MTPQEAKNNQETLNRIEGLGGAYVWDAEIFTVAFLEIAIPDEIATLLTRLTGVQQIAINPSQLTFSVLKMVAQIPNLESLVLLRSTLSTSQVDELRLSVVEVIEVGE